jgi:hypothetical protein
MDKITSYRESSPRYATLRLIGALSTSMGAILTAVGICLLLFSLYTLATRGWGATPPLNQVELAGTQSTPVPFLLLGGFSLLWSLGILLSGLQLIATGAFFRLMIHLEENTRASAQMLERMRSRPEGAEPFLIS